MQAIFLNLGLQVIIKTFMPNMILHNNNNKKSKTINNNSNNNWDRLGRQLSRLCIFAKTK